MILEIIIDKERLQWRLDSLRTRFPVHVITTSSFYAVVGCIVNTFDEDDKAWLEALADARVIHRYRCKQKEHTNRR